MHLYLWKKKLRKLIERKFRSTRGCWRQVAGVKDSLMKERLGKEYIGRIRKILKSKLNGLNMVLAVNS